MRRNRALLIMLTWLLLIFLSSCAMSEIGGESTDPSVFESSAYATATSAPDTTASSYSPAPAPGPAEPPQPVEITISFAGDCTFGSINAYTGQFYFPEVYEAAQSVSYPFDLVKDIFETGDLTVINFEGTLTNETEQADKQWHFKGDAAYAKILSASSVDVALLSNNHAFDFGEQGFTDTLNALERENIAAAYEQSPVIMWIKGIRVVIIGDCSVVGENTTVTEGVAERVLSQISQYRSPDSIIVVDMHWGSENQTKPSAWQQETARQFIDAGADLVVGQHPHVLQGVELYKDKYIVYSLGNFAFGGNRLARNRETAVLQAVFTVHPDGERSHDIAVIPCFTTSSEQVNEDGVRRNNYQPVPLYGDDADAVVQVILTRSEELAQGVPAFSVQEDGRYRSMLR